MDHETPIGLTTARKVLERGLQDGAYAGAVALVLHRGVSIAAWELGDARLQPRERPMRSDTIFDLASLTKVVAALPAILLLLDSGLLALDDTVAHFIPEFAAHGKEGVTIRHLLTHTSGLAAWYPLYIRARNRADALPVLCDLPLQALPGTGVVYSDLGVALIAYIVERVTGEPWQTFAAREIFTPLDMRDTMWLPPATLRERCAATEVGNREEQERVAQLGLPFDGWRDYLLVGEAHDPNTCHAFGGVSSHAGLFGTARDVARFAAMFLANGRMESRALLSSGAVREATCLQTGGLAPRFGLGWRLVDKTASLAVAASEVPWPWFMGDTISERGYGHTGFTGTSLVLDPARELAVVLLTNAVLVDPGRGKLARIRARFHNAIYAAVDGMV
jgi:CubicO group peptidase (beta-lactamase class C family)